MRAITNAQASVASLFDDHALLDEAMAAPHGMSAKTSDELSAVRAKLAEATGELGRAVAQLASGDLAGTRSERMKTADSAKARIDEADKTTEAARLLVARVSNETMADPKAAPALSAATGMLVDAEKASARTRAAVNQSHQDAGILSRRVLQALVIVAFPIIVGLIWWVFVKPAFGLVESYAFASLVIVATLLLITIRDAENGALGPIIGADKRLSTSKTQAAIWTVAIGFVIAFVVGQVLWSGQKIDKVLPSNLLDDYLILLGGPFAAGILAKLTVSWKVENGTLQKTEASGQSASQLVQDDAGNGDLVDSQYLMFNLIALGYFAVQFAQLVALPEIPTVLLGLTSASALTYTANKAVERNAPVITSVSPRSCLPGQNLRITGLNFLAGVEDASVAQVAVQIDGYAGDLRPRSPSSATELTVVVPESLAAGTKALTVRTAANVTSAPYMIEVIDSAPSLFGLTAPARVGASATAKGRNLRSPGSQTDPEEVAVTIGGLAVVGLASDSQVSFQIPGSTPKDTDVALTVSRSGSMSASITIHTSK